MKKALTLALAFCAALTLSAQEVNLMKNGGFEKIHKSTKASNKYIMGRIKAGWDFGKKPIITLPTDWVANVGAAKLEIVSKAADAKNVHSGNYALKMTAQKYGHIYTSGAKAGKYKVSMWVKGNGTIAVVGYGYAKKRGAGSFIIMRSQKVAGEEWKQITHTFDSKKINSKAESFAFALSVAKGPVFVDDIVLTPVK